MSSTGKDTSAASTPSFVSALVLGLAIVGALSVFFVIVHRNRKFEQVYQTRRVLGPEGNKPPELSGSFISWWKEILFSDDKLIIQENGLDAYLFVRFLKVFGLQMLVPYVILTCAILIPVSAASPNAGNTGLNKLTFGNVALNHQNRHIAHFLVALVLIAWTLYLIHREYQHFYEIRQSWLANPAHINTYATRTVAVIGVPNDLASEEGIKQLTTAVGGAPTNVWLTRDTKNMNEVYDERNDECLRLEGAEGKLLKLAAKNERKGKTPEKKGKLDVERAGASIVDRYVLPKKRPTWKQGFLGLFGRKMTLEDSPIYIADHNRQIEAMRQDATNLEVGNTAFVRFNSQHDAHTFASTVQHTRKEWKHIKTGIEVVPEDIEWSKTHMNPKARKAATIVSWALTIGLIIIWAIPVAFVGVVSNIDAMCKKASWLAWLCDLNIIPAAALGIIKGILPPVLLALLFMVLPMILRFWVKMQGEVRKSDVELKVFSRYWLFQVIHGFLIITISSGLIDALSDLGGMASSVPTLLAEKLPSASIFFLTFILATTFSKAAQTYSRVVPFVMHLLKGILGGNTPRKFFTSEYKMQAMAWATVWPPICLLICIIIVYSAIQPIITIVGIVAFALLYAAYKYTLGWCADQPDAVETGGFFYVKALRTIFVSLYLEEICLCGLFFLSQNEKGKNAKSGLACGAIMVAVIVATAIFQAMIDWRLFPKSKLAYAQSSFNPSASKTKLTLHQTTTVDGDDKQYGNTTGAHLHAFDHPSLWKEQPVVWVADDALGLGRAEVERINAAKVKASTEFAHMDVKGQLDVDRCAPDEAWYGGANRTEL